MKFPPALTQGEQDKSEWKESWIDKLNIHGVELPIITGVPKDESTDKISFSTFSRLRRMAEIIKDNSGGRFKTNTDVIRAAFYLGINLLFAYFNLGGMGYGQPLYDFFRRNERYYQKNQVLDDVVLEIKRLSEVLDKGYITFDEFRSNVTELVAEAPEDIRREVIETAKRVIDAKYNKASGFKIFDLFMNHVRKNLTGGD